MAKKRIPNDFYRTHTTLTNGLLDHPLARGLTFSTSFLECCVGDGAIAGVLKSRFPLAQITTNDIDQTHPADYHLDASTPEFWDTMTANVRPLWVVSNPPYNLAPSILPQAYSCAGRGVAMLLRLSILEPCKNRVGFLVSHPPTAVIVAGNPRPSYRPDGGTDNITTAWFIWDKKAVSRIGFITNDGNKW